MSFKFLTETSVLFLFADTLIFRFVLDIWKIEIFTLHCIS